MPCGPRCKAALDCTGYRQEMEHMVTAILCSAEKRDETIEDFIQLQHAQEMLWHEFLEKHYDFPPM